jgi:phosphate acetyltransferase
VQDDNLTSLIRDRYDLPFPAEQLYGCTVEEARDLASAGQYDELLKLILNKYMLLEEKCDIVLCAGTDYNGLVPSLEFDFNADLANNFGCSIVVVVKGFGRSPEEALHAVQMAHESMLDPSWRPARHRRQRCARRSRRLVRRRARAVLPRPRRCTCCRRPKPWQADHRRDQQDARRRLSLRRGRCAESDRDQL